MLVDFFLAKLNLVRNWGPPKKFEVKMKKSTTKSTYMSKQPNLIITRNGFDIIVN